MHNSMDNRLEELEAILQLENNDVITIMKTRRNGTQLEC